MSLSSYPDYPETTTKRSLSLDYKSRGRVFLAPVAEIALLHIAWNAPQRRLATEIKSAKLDRAPLSGLRYSQGEREVPLPDKAPIGVSSEIR